MTSLIKTGCKVNLKEDIARRLEKRSLEQILLAKFLNEYGYEKGAVAANALVRDIIETIGNYYVKADVLLPGEITWSAADKDERQAQGKTLDNTRRRLVKLSLFAAEDIEIIRNSNRRIDDIKRQRIARITKEAYQQGGVLTAEDLHLLLAVSRNKIAKLIGEYQKEKNEILPTRGNIADMGPGITHKRQILKLYINGMLTPEISRKTNHSRDAVDRYIRDYERIKTLNEQNFQAEEISEITTRGMKVVKEYLDIINNAN